MARQLRIQYEGAIYHLMSRGDRREEIFRDDLDRSGAKVGRRSTSPPLFTPGRRPTGPWLQRLQFYLTRSGGSVQYAPTAFASGTDETLGIHGCRELNIVYIPDRGGT
jgi:hypothetical protein